MTGSISVGRFVYRAVPPRLDADTLRVSPLPRPWFGAHQIQAPHLAIQIRALDAEHARGVGDAAAVLLQHRRDVVALELRARLAERGVEPRRADAAFELRMREDVLEPDAASPCAQKQTL